MKAKIKKPCEFEAMRLMAELLRQFSKDERHRIWNAVDSRLEAAPQPKPRGRKPKVTVQVPA